MSERHVAAYEVLRARVREVVTSAGEAALAGPSPATPSWRVRDVLAHLVGVTDDAVHGRLEGVATDSWTQAQVEARRGATAAEMLDEWDRLGQAFGELLAVLPDAVAGQALFDAVTHEHDVRHALRSPGARDSDAFGIAWHWFLAARTVTGLPTVRLVTEHGPEVMGEGEPVATVTASRFELFRAATGRRSAGEIERYGWDPAPRPDLLIASSDVFTLRSEPLGE
jgi:uncharacterized protein (TIGR03083 family)